MKRVKGLEDQWWISLNNPCYWFYDQHQRQFGQFKNAQGYVWFQPNDRFHSIIYWLHKN